MLQYKGQLDQCGEEEEQKEEEEEEVAVGLGRDWLVGGWEGVGGGGGGGSGSVGWWGRGHNAYIQIPMGILLYPQVCPQCI